MLQGHQGIIFSKEQQYKVKNGCGSCFDLFIKLSPYQFAALFTPCLCGCIMHVQLTKLQQYHYSQFDIFFFDISDFEELLNRLSGTTGSSAGMNSPGQVWKYEWKINFNDSRFYVTCD